MPVTVAGRLERVFQQTRQESGEVVQKAEVAEMGALYSVKLPSPDYAQRLQQFVGRGVAIPCTAKATAFQGKAYLSLSANGEPSAWSAAPAAGSR